MIVDSTANDTFTAPDDGCYLFMALANTENKAATFTFSSGGTKLYGVESNESSTSSNLDGEKRYHNRLYQVLRMTKGAKINLQITNASRSLKLFVKLPKQPSNAAFTAQPKVKTDINVNLSAGQYIVSCSIQPDNAAHSYDVASYPVSYVPTDDIAYHFYVPDAFRATKIAICECQKNTVTYYMFPTEYTTFVYVVLTFA